MLIALPLLSFDMVSLVSTRAALPSLLSSETLVRSGIICVVVRISDDESVWPMRKDLLDPLVAFGGDVGPGVSGASNGDSLTCGLSSVSSFHMSVTRHVYLASSQ